MATLHDVERRIKSVKSTRQITSTMYMIAATKVGRTAKRLERSHPYKDAISEMMQGLNKDEASFPLLEEHADKKTTLIIVIVSDQGLAGSFNSGILHLAQKYLDDNKRAGKNTKIIACGNKAHSYFSFREIETEMDFLGCSDKPDFSQAEKIGSYVIDSYTDENVDEVVILYNKCKNSLEQTIENPQILPIVQDETTDLGEAVFEPNEKAVLEGLVPLYIRTVIYDALLDSAAGEQVARRVAMQAATDSADEMIESLTRLYNSVRQDSITTELNEISGGANAIDEDS